MRYMKKQIKEWDEGSSEEEFEKYLKILESLKKNSEVMIERVLLLKY